jgi:hypothetical protein
MFSHVEARPQLTLADRFYHVTPALDGGDEAIDGALEAYCAVIIFANRF